MTRFWSQNPFNFFLNSNISLVDTFFIQATLKSYPRLTGFISIPYFTWYDYLPDFHNTFQWDLYLMGFFYNFSKEKMLINRKAIENLNIFLPS